MNKLVVLDSQVFIWAINLEDNDNQRDDVQRARTLKQRLDANKSKVVIPTPQLAELLSGCSTAEKRQELYNRVSRTYQVLPFDTIAAMKFGELMNKTLTDKDLREYFKQKDIYKSRMKFDCMIAASAITRNIECIWTHDTDLKRYADGQISVKLLDEIPLQTNLFTGF